MPRSAPREKKKKKSAVTIFLSIEVFTWEQYTQNAQVIIIPTDDRWQLKT